MKNPVEVIHESGRRTTVPARSVRAMERYGWRRTDEQPPSNVAEVAEDLPPEFGSWWDNNAS